jgi:hypothetical protein
MQTSLINHAAFGDAMFRSAALLLALTMVSQAQDGRWSVGIYTGAPDLKGRMKDWTDPDFRNFDLHNDFDLTSDKIGLGFHMEYLGKKLGFSLDYAVQDYAGLSRIDRTIKIGNVELMVGLDVKSSLENSAFDFTGIYKVWQGDKAWAGFNIGVQGWYLDLNAEGTSGLVEPVAAFETFVVPIPPIGVSGGYEALQDRLVLSGKAQFLTFKGASCTRYTADARYYIMPSLGIRAFVDAQRLDAPKDSIVSDIELKLDRNIVGFGVVARW